MSNIINFEDLQQRRHTMDIVRKRKDLEQKEKEDRDKKRREQFEQKIFLIIQIATELLTWARAK